MAWGDYMKFKFGLPNLILLERAHLHLLASCLGGICPRALMEPNSPLHKKVFPPCFTIPEKCFVWLGTLWGQGSAFCLRPLLQGCGSSAPLWTSVWGLASSLVLWKSWDSAVEPRVGLVTGVGLVPFLTTGFQGMSAETAVVSGLHHVDYYLGPLASFLPRLSFMFYRKH